MKNSGLKNILIFTITSIFCTFFLFRYYFGIIDLQKFAHYFDVISSRLGIFIGFLFLIFIAIWLLTRKLHLKLPAVQSLQSKKSLTLFLSLAVIFLTSALWVFQLNLNLDLIYKIAIFFTAFWITLWQMFLLSKLLFPVDSTIFHLSASILFTGVVFSLLTYADKVSIYPFSMDWSEGNRYYNAELFVTWIQSRFTTPLPVLHPTRYLLQAIPFLFTRNIFIHRLWQAILWVLVPLVTSFLIIKRAGIQSKFPRILIVLYFFLFMQQGPIYYHLLISIIPVLLWFNPRKMVRSSLVIIACSIWAALSRVNWYFMPLIVAVILYIFASDPKTLFSKKNLIRYVIWGTLTLISVFVTKYLYQHFSGNPSSYFDTAFSSALLWYRLLPNPTFLPGILLGIAIAIFPLGLWFMTLKKPGSLQDYRIFLLAGLLLVYFAGSIIVSIKIGGGSNLHNFDSFLVLLLISYAFVFRDPINNYPVDGLHNKKTQWLCIATVLIPLFLIVFSSNALLRFRDIDHSAEIPRVQEFIDLYADGKEVMCISQCQLFSFGYLTADKVEGKYEKILLMEMAMAENQDYLEEFRADIRNHRFPLIISEYLETEIVTTEDSFGDENNYWVQQVSNYILEYYTTLQYFKNSNMHILIPK